MKIALIGYGKMGKAIEEIARSRGHEVVAIINSAASPEAWIAISSDTVAIEFTNPTACLANIRRCFSLGVPVVVGTTGWYANFDEVKKEAESLDAGLFTATNFSIGVNLFWQVSRTLAKWMNHQPDYEVKIEEIHHIHKLDAPSGTAITTADILSQNLDSKSGWALGETTSGHEILIASKREGEVPGTHTIEFKSEIDRILLTHEAFNRKGFALGAVMAAEWMKERRGVYDMNDMLQFNQQ